MSDFKQPREIVTGSEIPVKAFYTPQDIPDFDYQKALANPGSFPFTRGIHPQMYRAKLWTMRQYAGYGTAKETNQRFKLLLKEGQMGLSTAFDLPTQMGYDPDDPKALGEVGRVGVNISNLQDMEQLFDGIPLSEVSASMTINATASILLSLYIAAGEAQGLPQEKVSGTLQNDILKEYIARGTYIFPSTFSIRLAVDVMEYCVKYLPRMNPISISGYHMREAGANAAEEIAFTFANALTYLEAAKKRGLTMDDLGEKISFFFASHNHFFEEIAKFRAARRLWARLMKEKFRIKNPKALMLRFHAQTAGSTLTSQQPLNNVPRVTLQALAAVLGGAQSLHTNAYDEALALPTEESATLALRTQQIIAHESGVTQSADPLAGAYFIEILTDELEAKVEMLLKDIESKGGALECVQSGYFERAISQSAYKAQKQMESQESLIVGVNAYASLKKSDISVLHIDPRLEEEACQKLREFKTKRQSVPVKDSLNEIRAKTGENANLIPAFIKSVKSSVTLGEICQTLRDIFGEYDSGTFHDTP